MIKPTLRTLVSFLFRTLVYVLLVCWFRLYWLLPAILLIFDSYFTHYFPWKLFRRFRIPRRLHILRDFLIVTISALLITMAIRVLFFEAYKIPTPSMEKTLLAGDYIFVSKIHYGPKLPNTPISIPFTPNILPSGKVTYIRNIELPYKRLRGFAKIKRGDVIVFNFPEGDTIVLQYPKQSYHSLVRQYGRDYISSNFKIISTPIDRRDNYIKRCIGIPGDNVLIKDNNVSVNGQLIEELSTEQFKYYIRIDELYPADSLFVRFQINKSDVIFNPNSQIYLLPISNEILDSVKKFSVVRSIYRYQEPKQNFRTTEIFPHSLHYSWTVDNFGPIWVPAKGRSIHLNLYNLPLYRRAIETYEKNKVDVRNDSIFINGTFETSYKFKMDYYFVLGDNRHNSADSRYWGFVPEDHVLGRAVLIWFSKDERKGLKSIHTKRIFKSIK